MLKFCIYKLSNRSNSIYYVINTPNGDSSSPCLGTGHGCSHRLLRGRTSSKSWVSPTELVLLFGSIVGNSIAGGEWRP